MDLIRFGGRVNYVDLVSSSFVEESLQALGGIRISIRRSLVAAGERPVAIYAAAARRSKAAGLIWPSVECRRRWL